MAFLLPYKVHYWWFKKKIRKAGYLHPGDIAYKNQQFLYVEKTSTEYPIIKLYTKNLITGEKYRNWHDWEQPMFKVFANIQNEQTAKNLIPFFQSTIKPKRSKRKCTQ